MGAAPRLARTLAVALELAAPLAARGEREASRALAVELVAPAAGTALAAGGQVELAWRPAGDAPLRFEEWEVFLSLDGGGSWPFRLTPHLDGTRRRAVVELPPFASPDARFLFRFGDERDEREVLLPHAFAIAPARAPVAAAPIRLAPRRGEAARAGQRGVAWWVEGPRSGASSRTWATAELAAGLDAAARLDALRLGLEPAERDGERPPAALPPPVGVADPAVWKLFPLLAAAAPPPRSSDLLALHVRRNQ